MKKRNKKGFTLVEMLAVVAIIAILVAVIVPVTAKALDKARAASNAANLRSIQAEIIINEDVDIEEFDEDKFYRIDDVGDKSGLDTEGDIVTYDGLTAELWAAVSNGEEVTVPSEGE